MKTRLLFLLFIGFMSISQAQVSINEEANDPHSSAMLDVSSTNKGLLIPRMSSEERIAINNPANGLMVFDLGLNTFWFYSESTNQWEEMSGAIVSVLNDLLDAKTDANSIYIGEQSGQNDDGNNFNVAVGQQSLKDNLSGTRNTSVGHVSLANNTTGINNTAIGFQALVSNQTGSGNFAAGYNSLIVNENGGGNTAVGSSSLSMNTGNQNTAIGSNAGGDTQNTSGNIFIGYQSGMNESNSNRLYIENSSSNTPLIWGDFDNDKVIIHGDFTTSGTIQAYGNTNLGSDLDVDNNISAGDTIFTNHLKISSGEAAEGKVLTSDDNGNATWQDTGSGAEEINDLTDAQTNGTSVIIGEASGQNINGIKNVGLGVGALFNNVNSSNNVAIGYFAGFTAAPVNTYGNIFIGPEAGSGNTENNQLFIDNSGTELPLIHGDFNDNHLTFNGTIAITEGNPALGKVLTSDDNGNASWEVLLSGAQEINELSDANTDENNMFIGSEAGMNNTEGTYNTAVGQQSMKDNISGKENVALGYGSLFKNTSGEGNATFGFAAMALNNTGNDNLAIGHSALSFNTVGSENTAVGNRSLLMNGGTQNTAIGKGAGQNSNSSASGNIFIGYEAGKEEDGSNKLYIENSASTTPLIGGNFDTDKVDINGELNVQDELKVYDNATIYGNLNTLSDISTQKNLIVNDSITTSNIKITAGNPVAGKVLTTDDDGNASWQESVANVTELNNLEDASYENVSLYLGEYAGQNNTDENNIGIGKSAMSSFENSTNNIAIGNFAGYTVDTREAHGNIIIGNNAGSQNMGDNQLIIDNGSTENPLIYGDFYTDHLKINGTLQITGGSPGDGKVLTSDAYGNASWNESIDAQSINDLSDGKTQGNSTYLGSDAGSYENVETFSTGVGSQALLKNRGNNNNAFGFNAMKESDEGESNSAFGTSSLKYNSEGDFNTAFGNYSLTTLETGNGNTAIGYKAGEFIGENTSGCVFIGQQAGSNELYDNKLYIENSNSSTPLIGGDFETDEVVINGTLQITGNNPGTGKILTSDEDGKASWSNLPEGVTSIDDLSDAINDGSSIYLGYGGYNDDGENRNTTIGKFALAENISGQNNVAIGESSLLYNTSGENNSALGKGALENSTDGDENTAIGYRALHYNNSGSKNTAIGFEAGRGFHNSNRVGNVFIGYQAGRFEHGNNKLYISNSDTTSPLIYGDFEYNELEFNGNVTVDGSLKITSGTPGNNKVLSSDPWGNASWKDFHALGFSELNSLDDAITSEHSIYLGENSGVNDDGTNSNTAVGIESLGANTTGSQNVAIGYQALLSSTDGLKNVAVGYSALKNNSIGYNTALGFSAGSDSYGSYNVYLGTTAGKYAQSSNSIFIGRGAGENATESNVLYIDNSSTEEPLIKGDFENDHLTINGDISVKSEINLIESQNGFLNLHPSAFIYKYPSENDYVEENDIIYTQSSLEITRNTIHVFRNFYAPVNLPNYVTIKKLTVYYGGSGSIDEFEVKLKATYMGQQDDYPTSLATVGRENFNAPSYSSVSTTDIYEQNEVVYNQNYQYFLEFIVNVSDYNVFELRGVIIEYEYNKLNH